MLRQVEQFVEEDIAAQKAAMDPDAEATLTFCLTAEPEKKDAWEQEVDGVAKDAAPMQLNAGEALAVLLGSTLTLNLQLKQKLVARMQGTDNVDLIKNAALEIVLPNHGLTLTALTAEWTGFLPAEIMIHALEDLFHQDQAQLQPLAANPPLVNPPPVNPPLVNPPPANPPLVNQKAAEAESTQVLAEKLEAMFVELHVVSIDMDAIGEQRNATLEEIKKYQVRVKAKAEVEVEVIVKKLEDMFAERTVARVDMVVIQDGKNVDQVKIKKLAAKAAVRVKPKAKVKKHAKKLEVSNVKKLVAQTKEPVEDVQADAEEEQMYNWNDPLIYTTIIKIITI